MTISTPGYFSERSTLVGNSTLGFGTFYLGDRVYPFSEDLEVSEGILKAE